MIAPAPGRPHIDNVICTLLIAGNASRNLDLDTIARFQQFDPAEFTARFHELETVWSLQPNNLEEFDGK